MRVPSIVGLVVSVLAVLPPAAAAQGEPLCKLGGSYEYQATLGPLLSPPSNSRGPLYPGGGAWGAAREALGAQYAGLWADSIRQGWSVALAPGPLDAQSARAAILDALRARFEPANVGYLDATLALYPTPYGEAELSAIQQQLLPVMEANRDLISGAGIDCFETDAFRVMVDIGPDATPDVVARTEAIVAPYGDRVFVRYGRGWLQAAAAPGLAIPPIRLADYVTLPAAGRCVRGRTVGVKAARRSDLRNVTLTAGRRRVTATAGKRARLALKARSTTITVRVRLRDGRTATRTLAFKRC